MNFFCDSGGNIFHVDSEKVYQGSVNANKIYFIGAFPSNCEVLVRYTLPNGIYSEQELCTKTTDIRLLEMHDKNGQEYNVWEVFLHKIVTQYFGTVAVQFSVVGSNGLLATALSSFEILRGVPVVIDTEDKDTLATQILQLVSELDIDTIRNMLETYQAKVEDLAKAFDTTQYITKNEFNDEVIESLTNNERDLTDIEKAYACEWLGAVSNKYPDYYYDECGGMIAAMFNSKGKNERPTHVLLWEQESSSDVMGSERIIRLPNEDGRLLTEEKAKQEYVEKDSNTSTARQVYGKDSAGKQYLFYAQSGRVNENNTKTVAMYDDGGKLYSAAPEDTDESAVANAIWCRQKFVTKITKSQPFLYGYTADPWGTVAGVDAAVIANTPQNTGLHAIPWYHDSTNTGLETNLDLYSLATGTPKFDYACANKKYVDDNAGGKLYRHHIKITDKNTNTILEFDTISSQDLPLITGEDIYNYFLKYQSQYITATCVTRVGLGVATLNFGNMGIDNAWYYCIVIDMAGHTGIIDDTGSLSMGTFDLTDAVTEL